LGCGVFFLFFFLSGPPPPPPRLPVYPQIIIALVLACALITHAQAPVGLDSLSDDRLLSDLALRGQTTLLERAFVVDKVPLEIQESLRAIAQLRAPDPHRTPRQRQELARKAAIGAARSANLLGDPQTLIDLASLLLTDAAARDVNTLEYWGGNTTTQASLRPTAEAIIALLDKAASIASTKADAIANTLKSPDEPAAAQYEQLASAAQNAQYTARMADYVLALSLDPADPHRAEVATRAIDYLAKFDNPDSQVQPIVRNRLGKLHMLRRDYDVAVKLFDSIAGGAGIQPAPSVYQQYEARYFAAVAELLAGHVDSAQTRLNELLAWQRTNLPASKEAQDGASAATSMLQYRIYAAKNQNDKAVAVLLELVKTRPDLSGVIFDQVVSRLPEDADLTKLDPLLLEGIIRRADQERLKPESEVADAKILERGLAAAKELMSRPGVDAQLLRDAQLTAAFLMQRLGHSTDAATAFLDYLQTHPGDANSGVALDAAQSIIGQLRKASPDDPDVAKLYERFLPIAIAPPFSRTQFAFEYAARLQRLGKYADAARYFEMVPNTDPRALEAKFFRMLALKQQLDEHGGTAGERADLLGLSQDVASAAKTALQANSNDEQRRTLRLIAARTTLITADLVRSSDPQQMLALLNDFDTSVDGLPGAADLLAQAMTLRVNAYMSIGDDAAATRTLVALLEKTGGAEGADIVFNLLTRLNADLDRARAANDIARVRAIAQNRAALSGFLVNWAKNHTDPRVRKYAYRYALFDAETHHIAADLEPDPVKRRALHEQALALYKALQSPENVELYRATLPPGADPNYPDPAVTLGIALIDYDLGDFKNAQPLLARLLADRKLGAPVIPQTTDGAEHLVDNDRYWEATLKLFLANLEIAKTDASSKAITEETANALKRLYIQWGSGVGGAKWRADFEKLRQQLIPDFKAPDLTTAPTR
jgi:hypothetical protein